ncbi:MAG: VTT domain-containing protein [Bacilli bacterium]
MNEISEVLIKFIEQIGSLGPILGCIFIFIESILPFIPLAIFITINFLSFGTIIGFIISWLFTVLGCLMSYFIFQKGLSNKFNYLLKDTNIIKKLAFKIKKLTFGKLVVLLAIPFFPAFAINIAAGLTKVDFKKYLVALLIGKIPLVYFWGFIGTNLFESITSPIILIKVILAVLVAYLISKLINIKLKLN